MVSHISPGQISFRLGGGGVCCLHLLGMLTERSPWSFKQIFWAIYYRIKLCTLCKLKSFFFTSSALFTLRGKFHESYSVMDPFTAPSFSFCSTNLSINHWLRTWARLLQCFANLQSWNFSLWSTDKTGNFPESQNPQRSKRNFFGLPVLSSTALSALSTRKVELCGRM
jgi:hypothetical protein